jgi:hypothetical protein
MTFPAGASGNPRGNRHHTRHLLNREFLQALLLHFRKDGRKVIERVARTQPATYMKICAWLIPKEMKIEHSSTVKGLSDEELESAIATLEAIMAAQASGSAKLVVGSAEPAALPTPEAQPIAGPERKRHRRPNRLMLEADTAVGPRERISRGVPPPSRA